MIAPDMGVRLHRPVDKVPPARPYVTASAERGEESLDVAGLVEDFHDVELPPVVESSPRDARAVERGLVTRRRVLLPQAVHEKDAATRAQRLPNDGPERVEPRRRDVRKPEREEHEVEAPVGLAGAEVGADVVHLSRLKPR